MRFSLPLFPGVEGIEVDGFRYDFVHTCGPTEKTMDVRETGSTRTHVLMRRYLRHLVSVCLQAAERLYLLC